MIRCLLAGFVGLWFLSLMVGWFVQPFAPWWFGQQAGSVVTANEPGISDTGIPIGGGVVSVPVIKGNNVTDAERYQLISAAGAPPQVAVIMTAISIAEDGCAGCTASTVSKPNRNGTVDIGEWQINSAHIGQCGIPSMQWLFDPVNNSHAAMCILGPHLNYCAWSTYETSCGVGWTGSYRAFLPCAQAIAAGGTCKR